MSECVFCDVVADSSAAAVVSRGEWAVAFLDRSPLFKGHVLVVPTMHAVTLGELPPDAVGPLFAEVQRIAVALPAALGCQGTFVAINNAVSQSVAHLHVHVVPRTKGDGLRGFFWPRQKYTDDSERDEIATRVRFALG